MKKKSDHKNIAANGGKWITPKRRKKIYERDNYECLYCGKNIYEDDIVLTLDHIISQVLGGDNRSDNLVTCCKSCNSSKGSKTIRQFYQILRSQNVDASKIGRKIRRQLNKSKSWKF